MPWANGLGTTSVIARWPDDEHWVWRLSLADVTTDGPFSMLLGIDRFIAVASGAGMDLSVGDDPPVRLTRRSEVFVFDGEATTTCRLVDGPIVDLNLMVRRGTATGALTLHRLEPGRALELPAGAVCVVLHGRAEVDDGVLEQYDAVIADQPERLTAVQTTQLAIATSTNPPTPARPAQPARPPAPTAPPAPPLVPVTT